MGIMDTKPVGRTQSYVCALMKVHIMYSLQSNGHTRLTHIPVVNAGEEDRDGSTLCHSFCFNLFQDIREAFIQEKCSFLTLFKKPLTPLCGEFFMQISSLNDLQNTPNLQYNF